MFGIHQLLDQFCSQTPPPHCHQPGHGHLQDLVQSHTITSHFRCEKWELLWWPNILCTGSILACDYIDICLATTFCCLIVHLMEEIWMEKYVLKTTQLTNDIQMGAEVLHTHTIQSGISNIFVIGSGSATAQISVWCRMSLFWNIPGPAEYQFHRNNVDICNVLNNAN